LPHYLPRGLDAAAIDGEGDVVVTHAFELIVPEDFSGCGIQTKEMAVTASVDFVTMVEDSDILE
jgi:hypothetical protein